MEANQRASNIERIKQLEVGISPISYEHGAIMLLIRTLHKTGLILLAALLLNTLLSGTNTALAQTSLQSKFVMCITLK